MCVEECASVAPAQTENLINPCCPQAATFDRMKNPPVGGINSAGSLRTHSNLQ